MPIFTVWPSLFRQDNSGIKLLRVLHQVAAEIRNGQGRAPSGVPARFSEGGIPDERVTGAVCRDRRVSTTVREFR